MSDGTPDNHHKCPDCGEVYVGKEPLNGHNCPEKVPIEELEQLADEWEEDHHGLVDAEEHWRYRCAQELRDLIAEYGDNDE